MLTKYQSITASQKNVLRNMLNNLAGRRYDDVSIEAGLSTLSKKQGVMLIKVVAQMLKVRSALNSDIAMTSLRPLLNDLGISVSLAIG